MTAVQTGCRESRRRSAGIAAAPADRRSRRAKSGEIGSLCRARRLRSNAWVTQRPSRVPRVRYDHDYERTASGCARSRPARWARARRRRPERAAAAAAAAAHAPVDLRRRSVSVLLLELPRRDRPRRSGTHGPASTDASADGSRSPEQRRLPARARKGDDHIRSAAAAVDAHGQTDMPVWGAVFRGLDPNDTLTGIRIENLVTYLASLQETDGGR